MKSIEFNPPKKKTIFIGLDGEAINHEYCLLGASDGTHIYHDSGALTTLSMLEYLWEFHKRGVLVWFGGHYDVNHLVRDLSDEGKDFFFAGGWVKYYNYELRYMPKKFLKIRNLDFKKASITIYETYSFFSTSFIKACEEFLGEVDPRILEGKEKRVAFTREDREMMIEYNALECVYLVRLMEKIALMLEANNLKITQWYGPSALANAVLRQHSIAKDYLPHIFYEGSELIDEAFRCAYFGGRIEALRLGAFNEGVYAYDINSAYPSAMLHLSAIGPEIDLAFEYEREEPFSVWLLHWDLPEKTHIGPLPYRTKNGRIYFPRNGYGWYWQPEVKWLMHHHSKYVRIEKGLIFKPTPASINDIIPEYYAKRLALKKIGDESQYILKILLNSIYGKFAQKIGAASFRNLAWAGYITSYTRAKLLTAAWGRRDVIAFATDGIITEGEIEGLSLSKELGAWNVEGYDSARVIMPGIYRLDDKKIGNRGFKHLDWGTTLEDLTNYRYSDTEERIFISHTLARAFPEAFGKDYLKFIGFTKRIEPDNLDKRIFNLFLIRDWNTDSCGSSIISLEKCPDKSAPIKMVADEMLEDVYYEEDI
jgi:hypothetical protein